MNKHIVFIFSFFIIQVISAAESWQDSQDVPRMDKNLWFSHHLFAGNYLVVDKSQQGVLSAEFARQHSDIAHMLHKIHHKKTTENKAQQIMVIDDLQTNMQIKPYDCRNNDFVIRGEFGIMGKLLVDLLKFGVLTEI